MITVFDLDDTLYEERTFVESGFRAVAQLLSPRFDMNAGSIETRLLAVLDSNGRGRVFDEVLNELGVGSGALLQECVEVYRSHEPLIHTYDGIREMLARHPGASS